MEELYHIRLSEIPDAKYGILTGDPGRVERIASYLDNSKEIGNNREFVTYKGRLSGEDVVVCSTGIGGASMAIVVEELYMAGVRTFIRVGTCGGMQTKVLSSDLVIASGAIRAEGTTREYVPIEFPAVASFDVVNSLKKAAQDLKMKYHIGVVQSKDSFYGQHNPERMPVGDILKNNWEAWIKSGCLASEMECAALFIVCAALNARCGAVLHTVWNQEREARGLSNNKDLDEANAIKTAIKAVLILIDEDKNQ